MSNANPPRPRRSLRIVLKIFWIAAALAITFLGSFMATLVMKSDHPADYFNYFGDENFSEEEVRSTGAPEIKTIFDEQNRQSFDPARYAEGSTIEGSREVQENSSAAAEEKSPPDRREDDTGFVAKLGRMTSIAPAVDEKVKNIPHYVKIDDIPFLMRRAILAVEDTRFYEHSGFDLIGIARAVLANVEAGEIQQGGSTITQQTVKNLFLTSDKTFARKAEELILARSLEKNFGKDKILELYLNSIYFGSNFYGIYDAAQGYFGKKPDELSIAECAMLAGLPNAPSIYSPYVDFRSAKKRQLVVIDAMENLGIISKREAESARIEEIILAH